MQMLLILILMIFVSDSYVFAQEAAAPAPPAAMPTVSAATGSVEAVAQTPAQVVTNFPALPPSRPCVAKNIWGVWHLVGVFESPASTALASFKAEPNQYAYFHTKNNLYKEVKSEKQALSVEQLKHFLPETPSVPQQYVLNQGFMYFYKGGAYTATMACFVVATSTDQFTAGQMLLMPPAPAQGQPSSRMVKVYQKVFGLPLLPQNIHKPAPPRRR